MFTALDIYIYIQITLSKKIYTFYDDLFVLLVELHLSRSVLLLFVWLLQV